MHAKYCWWHFWWPQNALCQLKKLRINRWNALITHGFVCHLKHELIVCNTAFYAIMVLIVESQIYAYIYEPHHEIYNNLVYLCDQRSLRSACAYAQSDQSLCWSLEYSMTVKLLGASKLKGRCTGFSESIHVKMPQCWKSHVTAQLSRSCMYLVVLKT